MKNPYRLIGIVCVVVSLSCAFIAYRNSKININTAPAEQIQYIADKIDGIGDKTAEQLIKDVPIAKIEDVAKLPAIGEKRTDIISKRFCVYDTYRYGIFILTCAATVIFSIIASVITTIAQNKKRMKKERQRREEKELDRALGIRR